MQLPSRIDVLEFWQTREFCRKREKRHKENYQQYDNHHHYNRHQNADIKDVPSRSCALIQPDSQDLRKPVIARFGGIEYISTRLLHLSPGTDWPYLTFLIEKQASSFDMLAMTVCARSTSLKKRLDDFILDLYDLRKFHEEEMILQEEASDGDRRGTRERFINPAGRLLENSGVQCDSGWDERWYWFATRRIHWRSWRLRCKKCCANINRYVNINYY